MCTISLHRLDEIRLKGTRGLIGAKRSPGAARRAVVFCVLDVVLCGVVRVAFVALKCVATAAGGGSTAKDVGVREVEGGPAFVCVLGCVLCGQKPGW